MPSVSCIIPVYNAAPYLERAVQSLLACRLSELEIVIVDDGSKDESLTVAQEIVRRVPEAQLLRHPRGENRGVSATRNLGLETSTGELICFLDGDDYVYPHRFDTALNLLTIRPEVDGVYDLCELVFADDAARSGWPTDDIRFGFTEPIPSDALLVELLKARCWSISALLFRRSLLERTGLFDPQLQIAEDCNLWFRMASVGQLVAGDLTKPVSAYWRTTGSAFQPATARRLQMLQSMHHFLKWLAARPEQRQTLRITRQCVRDYAIKSIIAARGRQEKQFAWSLAAQSVQMFPSLLLDYRFQRQLLSMSLGK